MSIRRKAQLLRDQVKKTWTPPLLHHNASQADCAQTAVMGTIAWVFGKEFLGELTSNQNVVIEQMIDMLKDELK